MTYQDVEYKLAQYAQWCGNPLRALDYPGRAIYARAIPDARHNGKIIAATARAIYARAIPDAIDPDALPAMTDAEARVVGDALLALKRFNDKAHIAIVARFLGDMTDDEIGRKHRFGSRYRVHDLRIKGYWFLQGRLSA